MSNTFFSNLIFLLSVCQRTILTLVRVLLGVSSAIWFKAVTHALVDVSGRYYVPSTGCKDGESKTEKLGQRMKNV